MLQGKNHKEEGYEQRITKRENSQKVILPKFKKQNKPIVNLNYKKFGSVQKDV